MKTKEERKREFIKDLDDLLKKHDAEIILEGNSRGEDKMVVTMMNKFEGGECVAEYTEFNLGRYRSYPHP